MSVYSIWESRYPLEAAEEGLETTKAIWADMRSFDGYLDHEIVEDLDDHGHLSSSASGGTARPLRLH